MAIPRLRPSDLAERVSDEVELYHRTYSTLLRSSGETLLRVLESSHRAMESSLHAGAASNDLDLGAFLYALNRLPPSVWRARLVAMGQEETAFERAGFGNLEEWPQVEAPARRRRWHDNGDGTLVVLIASSSDLDDLIPTLVAYQIEWNKLHEAAQLLELPEDLRPSWCAERLGGSDDDWDRVTDAWKGDLRGFLDSVRETELELRIRMLGGSEVGYGRVTRRWWEPILTCLREQGLGDRRLYLVSSNTHSLVNLVTGTARLKEEEIVGWVEENGPRYLRDEL